MVTEYLAKMRQYAQCMRIWRIFTHYRLLHIDNFLALRGGLELCRLFEGGM